MTIITTTKAVKYRGFVVPKGVTLRATYRPPVMNETGGGVAAAEAFSTTYEGHAISLPRKAVTIVAHEMAVAPRAAEMTVETVFNSTETTYYPPVFGK